MNKEIILKEIKRIAEANGGKPPGRKMFATETGIREYDWFPDIWLKWSEALEDAGFSANKMQSAYSESYLIEKLTLLIRELRHFPTSGEIRRKSRQDRSFPNNKTLGFKRFGGKPVLAQKIVEFYGDKDEWRDVVDICNAISCSKASLQNSDKIEPPVIAGVVYLIKSGKYYKIGKTMAIGRREYELSIQLPEPPKVIHSINTDDPAGIEAYWHNRFATKRKGGEWFDLTPDDIKAFRRRKYM